jgi:Domain of unknown function (DUF4365)
LPNDNSASRRIGKGAVNKVRTFFETNDLIFNKIDQEDDIGIDATLTLARTGPDAGLAVGLQIKGGRKYKRNLHVDEWYRRRGQASFRSGDWQLWREITPPRGFEGHHVVDIDLRLRAIWRNSRLIYIVVHDPDDDELYFGNLARMADVEPLDQDLARAFERMGSPEDNSPFYRYLKSVHRRISGLSEDQRRCCKTMIPLYPDLRLTPDGLDRFLAQARAEARRPRPDPSSWGGKLPTYVTYPGGTVGLSREALDAIEREEGFEERREP